MIISKAPLRISFSGGGTDLKDFFVNEPGVVINTSIDKYVYVAIHKYFDDPIILKYSQTEIIDDISKIKHPLFRETLRMMNIQKGIEVSSMADVSSHGTGLGSSSTFLVALLNALYAHKRIRRSATELAKEACKIERDILKEDGGYQDQYISAYGGFNFTQFNPDQSVVVSPILCSRKFKKKLNKRLIMFFTGITRKSDDIHKEQRKNTDINLPFLKKMKEYTLEMKKSLETENLNGFGEILHENWKLKKQLASSISTSQIDDYYKKAREAGAVGGKISGAGGGGFLLFYAEPEKHDNIRKALSDLKEFKFGFESEGARIIYDNQ